VLKLRGAKAAKDAIFWAKKWLGNSGGVEPYRELKSQPWHEKPQIGA